MVEGWRGWHIERSVLRWRRVCLEGGGVCLEGGGVCLEGGGVCLEGGGVCLEGGGMCLYYYNIIITTIAPIEGKLMKFCLVNKSYTCTFLFDCILVQGVRKSLKSIRHYNYYHIYRHVYVCDVG